MGPLLSGCRRLMLLPSRHLWRYAHVWWQCVVPPLQATDEILFSSILLCLQVANRNKRKYVDLVAKHCLLKSSGKVIWLCAAGD